MVFSFSGVVSIDDFSGSVVSTDFVGVVDAVVESVLGVFSGVVGAISTGGPLVVLSAAMSFVFSWAFSLVPGPGLSGG